MAYATGHFMENQGVDVLCVWNKTEKNEMGIFVVKKMSHAKRCLERAELKDWEQVLLFVITSRLPVTQLV